MSRLTGNDAKSLMEAYAAVYTPQITEEQVWEEVEEWVNSLVEEGYDLSEYSWEEMYEAYLSEMGQQGGNRPGQGSTTSGAVTMYAQPRRNDGKPFQSRFSRPRLNSLNEPSRPQSLRNFGTGYRGQELQLGARAAASQVGTNRQGSAGTGAPPSSAAQPAAQPPRNQPPAARPPAAATAGGAGARPPAGAPTGKPAPAASTPARASSPANATTAQKIAGGTEVYNKQRAAGDFKAASETGKQVFSAAQPKLAAAAAERERTRGTSATTNPLMKDFKSRLPAPAPAPTTTSSTSSPFTNTAAAKSAVTAATKPAPAPAPKPTPAATGSKKPGSIVSHYDPFDVVIGHLLDEGYADSEESALAIMANMSEEWKNSIIQK